RRRQRRASHRGPRGREVVRMFGGVSPRALAADRSYACRRETGRSCYAPLKLLMGSGKGGAMTTTTRSAEWTAMTATLFLAMELGSTRWKLAFAVTRAPRPRLRTIRAGDL